MNISVSDLIEVKLKDEQTFLKVKETLTRIGVASRKNNVLFQSCHILHKRDKQTGESRYFIVHFKELFALDGKQTDFDDNDVARRNTIANLLDEWELVSLVDPDKSVDPVSPMNLIKVLRYDEKEEWELVAKYSIGKKH